MVQRKKKVAIITLGCAKNQVDSEALASQFAGNDIEVTLDVSEAEVAIINTCGFIEEAKQQSIETILETLKLKGMGKLEKVYVMGCLSERYHNELEKEIPEVDRFFGSHHQPLILNELGADYKYELIGERVLSTPHHYAYLKISEGCDNPCSFCAIPLMRGNHRSKPIEQIMDEVIKLTAKGVKELIVIGQDTTYYGLDLYGKRKLASLLTALSTVNELEWIRLMYAYPAKFPLDILDVYAEQPKICRYLDLPVQHISDSVLRSMRRGITRRATEDLLRTIRDRVPGIALRTTLITGYPTETDKDVDELVEFIREFKFDRLGVFTYSLEDGTAIAAAGDPVPPDVKEERRGRIMEAQREIAMENNQQLIGKRIRVLFEREEDGSWIGRSERDAPEIDNEVLVAADGANGILAGSFSPVHITDADEYDLYGVPADGTATI
ncbi:MAG: 30S ribosomal protein S12 methylthiotransferase RimO [Ignavibacteriales bacterium]|nr:30S ribosomal protein S12 methylthiotransferase RimO [Ignavibacteriales bacterium]